MKGKRFSEEKIIYILKEQEARAKMSDLVRRHSVSEQSIYRWKSKYGVVAIVEHRLDGVISHLFNAVNIDALLATCNTPCPGPCPCTSAEGNAPASIHNSHQPMRYLLNEIRTYLAQHQLNIDHLT